MTRHITLATVVILLCTAICFADTFKHRETGEVFNGFATQKSIGNRTRVYNADLQTFKPIVLAEYDVTPNAKGRRNSVIVMPLKQAEVLLSKAVSETLANAIVDASNKGPKLIVIEIDNPGGRGEYMKNISTTITKTLNCPTVAYISGGTYGGAYSAATALLHRLSVRQRAMKTLKTPSKRTVRRIYPLITVMSPLLPRGTIAPAPLPWQCWTEISK
jgi:membrane-bound ClpP family serine protease